MKQQIYIKLLLTSDKNQAKALLETADKHQVEALIHLIYNITVNKSSISTQSKKLLSKHQKLISKLLNKKNTNSKNYSIIRHNSEKIYSILSSVSKVLLRVIQ